MEVKVVTYLIPVVCMIVLLYLVPACESQDLPTDYCDLLLDGQTVGTLRTDEALAEIKKHIFYAYLPKAGRSAGEFNKLKHIDNWEDCMTECCSLNGCDVAFFTMDTCYYITCEISPVDACLPVPATGSKHNNTVMVVRDLSYLKSAEANRDVTQTSHPAPSAALASTALPSSLSSSPKPLSSSSSSSSSLLSEVVGKHVDEACSYGLRECVEGAECVLREDSKARQGKCACKDGWTRSQDDLCLQSGGDGTAGTSGEEKSDHPASVATPANPPPQTVTKLTVSAGTDKILQLPENTITLTAFVLPKPEEGETYTYEWSPVKLPDNAETATMDGKNTDTLKLSNLVAGLYILKVKVTGENKFGEADINVTVLPAARENKPPQAVIHPATQEVVLPNFAILDGSGSTDDDKIVLYKWEEVSGPLQNHELTNDQGQMLTLKDLAPGNYTFRLTVTDSDGATNSTSANVTIKKEKDYPPVADAGSDAVLFLPQNSLTLYGNNSADDKGDLSYEWIKTAEDKLTADMTGVRTPFLHLSNLEVGDYTFTLKVTDSGGQTDTADVHVFVKPESKHPPQAKTAGHLEFYLPQDTLTLNGTNSTDEEGITEYKWTQKSGPTRLTIANADQAVAIVTGKIAEGDYEFELSVTDREGQHATDTLVVSLLKKENHPPKANAGGNQVVQVPVSLITLDGSKSTGLGIRKYLWQRDTRSPAAGMVVNNSDHMAVLQLVNPVVGQYLFTLTVEDEEGLSSTDSATVRVEDNPHKKDFVEMILDTDIEQFSVANKESVADQLELMLQSTSEDRDTIVDFVDVSSDVSTGYLCLTFRVLHGPRESSTVMKGLQALHTLKSKVSSQKILDYSIVRLDLSVCQNNCSGHGHCDQRTKTCVCEAFWMSNFFTSHLWGTESNCDWSILYVVIISFIILVALISAVWAIICCCTSKRCKMKLKSRRRHRYSLLRDADNDSDKEKIEMLTKGKIQQSSLMVSESELSSDEETLFVSNKKTVSNGLNGKAHNGSRSLYTSKLKT